MRAIIYAAEKVGQAFLPGASFVGHCKRKGKAKKEPALAKAANSRFLLYANVRHIFCERILLVLPESPGGFEMLAVNQRIHRVVHVAAVGALQVCYAGEIKLQG